MYEFPYQNGELHGIMKEYYVSGQLKAEMPWVNNTEHGLNCISKKYYKNGQIKEESWYVDGYLRGTNNYDENGNIIIKK